MRVDHFGLGQEEALVLAVLGLGKRLPNLRGSWFLVAAIVIAFVVVVDVHVDVPIVVALVPREPLQLFHRLAVDLPVAVFVIAPAAKLRRALSLSFLLLRQHGCHGHLRSQVVLGRCCLDVHQRQETLHILHPLVAK